MQLPEDRDTGGGVVDVAVPVPCPVPRNRRGRVAGGEAETFPHELLAPPAVVAVTDHALGVSDTLTHRSCHALLLDRVRGGHERLPAAAVTQNGRAVLAVEVMVLDDGTPAETRRGPTHPKPSHGESEGRVIVAVGVDAHFVCLAVEVAAVGVVAVPGVPAAHIRLERAHDLPVVTLDVPGGVADVAAGLEAGVRVGVRADTRVSGFVERSEERRVGKESGSGWTRDP